MAQVPPPVSTLILEIPFLEISLASTKCATNIARVLFDGCMQKWEFGRAIKFKVAADSSRAQWSSSSRAAAAAVFSTATSGS